MRWMMWRGKPAWPYEPVEQGEGKLEPNELVRKSGERR